MKRKQQATTSGEDYLEAILVLQMQKGTVRSVDVARHMEVSKPSVSHAVATLRDGQRLFPAPDRHWPGSGGTDLRKAPFLYRASDCRRRGSENRRGRCLPD